MVNQTHHVTMFSLKRASPEASQEVPSGSDGGSSDGGDSGGFPEYHETDCDLLDDEFEPSMTQLQRDGRGHERRRGYQRGQDDDGQRHQVLQ